MCIKELYDHLNSERPGMALGFFILGPRTRTSGQIGVPSNLGGSQNLGDPVPPPQEIVIVVVMRKSDW